ncbi:MAG: ATP-dependent helicase, partial [bacterium]|nr:ATP-dependent helicase [bacterium]
DSVSRERLEKNFGKNRFLGLAEKFLEIERVKKSYPPMELIEVVLKTTDYLEYLERNFINYSERHENVGELVAFASRFDDLQTFLEEIALVQQTDMPTSATDNKKLKTENIVHLSTIHLAKGLEFDRVFIAGASEGLLPHAMSIDKDEQLEEERRLMYVAMTRAKKELCLSFYDLPSRFLSEIPRELIELNISQDKDFGSYEEEKFISLPE